MNSQLAQQVRSSPQNV